MAERETGLNEQQVATARSILDDVRKRLEELARGDDVVLLAARRYISKRLMYDERGKPLERKLAKAQQYVIQKGLCAFCGNELPLKGAHAHRLNSRERPRYEPGTSFVLVHRECHEKEQAERGYAS